MSVKSIGVLFIVPLVLAGCLQNDAERAAAGAAAGAATAAVVNGNVLTGAAIGGLAGAICDDVNICN